MRDDWERLVDIQEEICLIEKYAVKGRKAFDEDELIQTWMVKHLENIGEAARSMSKKFRADQPQIPWEDMISQRTYLAHEYFGIDRDEIWDTIEFDIPKLKKQIEELLGQRQG